MAYFDHMAAARKKECADKYEELKDYITSENGNGNFNEWLPAYQHMISMESEIKAQEKLIKEYQNFFSFLKRLLPDFPQY